MSDAPDDASNPASPPERLRSLAASGDARVVAELIRNPATPVDALLALLHHDPEAVLRHPAIARHFDVAPQRLEAFASGMSVGIADWDTAPPGLLDAAAASPDASLRECAAPVATLSPARITALCADTDDGVRAAAATNPAARADLIERLALRDPSPRVRAAAARHPTLPAATLRALSDDDDAEVRAAVAMHPVTPPDVQLALARGATVRVWRALAWRAETPEPVRATLRTGWAARNPNVPLEVLTRCAERGWPALRAAVASNPAGPPALLERLARDPNSTVRAGVASNPRAPPALLATIARDPEADAALVRNPATPREVLLDLGRGFTMRALLERDDTPAELLTGFAGNPDPLTRGRIARHPNATPALWRALLESRGSTAHVIAAVLEDPRVPAEILLAYAERRSDAVSPDWLARNPALPPEHLARLATHASPTVRGTVAANPSTPRATLEALARDAWWHPREKAASNLALPPERLSELARDSERRVRAAVAGNPSTPVSTLEALCAASEPDFDVPHALASNPRTPPTRLAVLAAHPNALVRRAAARNPSTPADQLARRAHDADPDTRRAVASNPSCPDDALFALAREPLIGFTLLGRATLPPALFALLAAHGDLHLRRALAAQARTPVEILTALADDRADSETCRAALANPALPYAVIAPLFATLP